MDLFFVLSGYLVSGLLFAEWQRLQKVYVGHFLVRRAFKIYPALWVLVLSTFALRGLSGTGWDWSGLAAEMLFVQNYLPGLWPHTWSLAVEEHFYLALAAFAAVMTNKAGKGESPFKWVPLVFVVVAVTCLALRIATVSMAASFDFRKQLSPTHLRLDALSFGVLLSWIRVFGSHRLIGRTSRLMKCALPLAACALCWPFLIPVESSTSLLTIGLSAIYLASGSLVWLAAQSSMSWDGTVGRALRLVGYYSY